MMMTPATPPRSKTSRNPPLSRRNLPRAAKGKAIRRIALISKGKKLFIGCFISLRLRSTRSNGGRGGRSRGRKVLIVSKKWTKVQIKRMHHSLRCSKNTNRGRGGLANKLGLILLAQDKKNKKKALKLKAKRKRERAQKRKR